MEVRKCKFGWVMMMLLLWSPFVSAKEFTQTVKKNSSISKNGLVYLSNTQGKIVINTWDKSEISVDVLITVNARNQSDANNVFERIRILFDSGSDEFSAKTEIREMPRHSWSYVRSEYTVDYIVNMPKTCNLKLFNKFGDALISELEGRAKIKVLHGNIRLKTVESLLTLDLKYGNCTVARAFDSNITMSHGNIKMKRVNDINLLTSYSKVNVDTADYIKSQSINDTYTLGIVKEFINNGRYDDIAITKVDNIILISKFSDFKVNTIQQSANIDMVHGSVVVDEIAQGFSKIAMVGERTDFQLKIAKGSEYKVAATAQNASVMMPKVCKVVRKYDNGDLRKVEFYVGKKVNPYSYIKARVKNGDLSVR